MRVFSFNAWQTHRMNFLKISNKWEVAYYKHWFGEQSNVHNSHEIHFFRLLSLPLRYIKRQPSWHGGTKRDLRVGEQDSERKMEKERARKGKETGRHVLGNGKAFKWDSNLGDMSACLRLGSLTFSQLSMGAKAAFFPLIVEHVVERPSCMTLPRVLQMWLTQTSPPGLSTPWASSVSMFNTCTCKEGPVALF